MNTFCFLKRAILLLVCGSFVVAAPKALSQESLLGALTSNINIDGLETQYDPETGVASAVGDVHIKYQNVEIRAGRADYNTNTGEIVASERVVIIKDGEIFRGEHITYSLKTEELKASHIRSGLGPIFYETDNLKTKTGQINKIDGDRSSFTTHDSEKPNYHITARQLTIYPDDRVVMHGAKVYLGNTPIFYLPYYVQPLGHELGYYFRPGFSSQWGAFLFNQYGTLYGDHTLAKWMFDLRSKRGVGGGVDLKSLRHEDNPNIGELLFYVAHDSAPSTSVGSESRASAPPSSSRYRISFHHRIYLPGPQESTWYLDFDINKLSDQFFLEDYYLNEFRSLPEPDNTIKLVKHTDRWVAMLLARMQLNKFFHTDTRLPELALDFTRAQIGHSNIYYQGENSLGLYQDKLSTGEIATLQGKIKTQTDILIPPIFVGPVPQLSGTTFNSNVDILRQQQTLLYARSDVEKDLAALQAELSENKFFRAHSYHEFLYPMSFGENNWFNIVPRLGGGVTYYNNVSGGTRDIGSATQPIFHAGMDISGKFSRVYDQVDNHTLGLDQLRHIVEPYVNYSYLQANPIDGLPGIDHITGTTRPRPIDVPLFGAIDSLSTWNVARIGVRNLLQTRRDVPRVVGETTSNGNTVNWMGLNTYVDVFLKDPEYDRKISNLYNDFFWNPVPWLRLNIDSQIPIGSSNYSFSEINTSVTWMPVDSFRWTIGHQFLHHNPVFIDSSLLYSRIYFRLNDTWGFDVNHIYEVTDHTLEYQSYSIHRDLTSWTASLGALIRNNVSATNGNSKELGLILSFTLKDFPQVGIPLDIDPNPTGRGGRL